MLENVPISALAICYAPLALTILGFIVFAWWTDEDARRRYLRQIDLRPESERPETQPIVREKEITAQTPAGSLVTIKPEATKAAASIPRGGPVEASDSSPEPPPSE